MASLPELDQFDAGVYQIETTDLVIGGVNGIDNLQAKALGNRTHYLRARMQDGALTYSADTGTADAYAAATTPPVAALVDGMEARFVAAHNNDGPSTFTPNPGTIAVLPILAGDHAALIGGEIVTHGEVTLRLNMALNAPDGAWVIMASTGGTRHSVTPATGNNGTEVATMAAVFASSDGMATVNVAVGADVTLSKAQYGSAMLNLSGTPTADINLIFPAQTGQWIIANNQGGAKNITAKTAAGMGVVIPQGVAVIVYCDGTNVGFAGSAGQSAMRVISITGVSGSTLTVSGGYTAGNILLEKNGAWLEPGDYTATDGTTITLVTAAVSTDKFTVYAFSGFSVSGAVSKAGDTMSGLLTLAGNATNPLHAVPKQQLDAAIGALSAAPVGTAANLKAGLATAGTAIAFTADQVVVGTALNGSFQTLPGFNKTLTITGTGAGGMDTGSAPANGFLAIYAIAKPDGTQNILGVNAATNGAPTIYPGTNMAAGYTESALIGLWPTNGSSQMMAAAQKGRTVVFSERNIFTLQSGTAGVYAAQSLSAAVPAAAVWAMGSMGTTSSGGRHMQVASDANGTYANHCLALPGSGTLDGYTGSTWWRIPMLTAQTCYWRGDTTESFYRMGVIGYEF